ncbi:MAG: VanZ family protein [Candidatus Sericytochromatia bacterium]|nr:VanZ family protein [Candidatus Sericytochromatia bacterium]
MQAFVRLAGRAADVPRWVRWGSVLAWMALIYLLSAQSNSGEHSSALVTWLLGLIGLSAEPPGLAAMQFAIRKLGHLSEYAVLAALLGWALRPGQRRWATAWGLAVAWAATDEWHQAFVPNRVGTPADVVIDGVGAAAAALAGQGLERARRRR